MINILYVDDDSDDRILFNDAVQEASQDVSCTMAIDGFDALEKLSNGDLPACIYIDINMPRMTGIELLEKIKRDPACSKIPVFILSTAGSPADKIAAMKLGAVDYLIKPDTFNGMKKLLASCLMQHAVIESKR